MEIKLKTTPSDADSDAIVDEYGVLWNFSDSEAPHGIRLATTKGLDGEAIRGFHQNGKLFIVDLGEAKKYFSSRKKKRVHSCQEDSSPASPFRS